MSTTTFITITTSDVYTIFQYGSELVGGVLPLILLVLGIGLGLWVISRLIFHR